jgi:iron complex transport system ATP-binding protein
MEGVDLGYGARTILSDISLKINSGQIVGIIGPNGSGKSTILKALCGLIRPSAGRVSLDGIEMAHLSREALARQVGVVPQAPLLPESFTVLETVLMGRYPHLGLLRSESKKDLDIACCAMERTNVQSLAHRRVGQISGGERQRVLVARVLAQEPRFLLLDEPTTHLDIQHQLEVMELVRSLADSGLGVVEAVHDVSLAGRFCDRLILLKEGHIFKEGTPQAVVTPDNIEQVFGVMAMVYGDLASGLLVVNTSIARPRSSDGRRHIHVIGGGGSAGDIMQRLYLEGYRLTIGVLNQGDTDLSTALALGAEAIVVPPFARIDSASHRRNMDLAAQADCCLVANVPFGQGNLLNLEAAGAARRLVLVDDRPIEQRDFTDGAATTLYSHLKPLAWCTDTANLKEALENALLQAKVTNAKH